MALVLSLPISVVAHGAPPDTASPAAPALAAGQLQLILVTAGLDSPIGVVNAGDGSGRLFIVERVGTIRVVQNGQLQAGTFLDITDRVLSGGERGLLGLAFHPDFASNRFFYVFYTRQAVDPLGDGDLIISRFQADVGLGAASSATEQQLLEIEHSSRSNHNGGQLAFGPDGFLYIGTGDGGGSGDPDENGQDPEVLLGKILRIDVDVAPYVVPPDNPFVNAPGLDEIWALGMRNPWRFSFDRLTGALWIGDVGEDLYEEIDRQAADDPGGHNYGWKVMEGMHCYDPIPCDQAGLTLPIAEYTHDDGCSVTGGYVYRGTTWLDLVGEYVFADYCTGLVWTIPATGVTATLRLNLDISIASFGESEAGELYAVDRPGGRLYRVVAPPFDDIASSYFLDDINWLFKAGITSGCTPTSYCPDDIVSREQMASFLARALELSSTSSDFFTDDETSIHEVDINRLAAAEITAGCTASTFCPTAQVTREQMASFLARALDLPATSTDYFTDDETSIHEVDINRLAAAGITTGCTPTTFCPTAHVTRGQLAAFLNRAL